MAKKNVTKVKKADKPEVQRERTSEELGFTLGQAYVQMMQAKDTITAINQELQKRQQKAIEAQEKPKE